MNSSKNRRPIIFPIDGATNASMVINRAKEFFSNDDVVSRVSMLKLNDGLHISGICPSILSQLRMMHAIPDDIGFFIDLKIVDVKQTVSNTLKRYAEHNPEVVTVFSGVAAHTLSVARNTLPNTKIALVDTLTDITPSECFVRWGMTPAEKIARAIEGFDAVYVDIDDNPIDLIVCAGEDVDFLKSNFGDRFGFICPGIRDKWMLEEGNKDHQERISGIYDALEKGVTYVVMGTQLTVGNPNANISARESRLMTCEEMQRYFYINTREKETSS